jgi:UPF0716 protein FxsA
MHHPIMLLAALLALPLVELAVLLKLGALTDWKVPLLAVVVMAGAGIALIRSIGWLTFRQFQEELKHRRVPGNAILDTLCLFLAGLLFLFPGILTDFLGLMLLIPPTRFLVKRAIVGWIGAGVRDGNVTVRMTVDGGDPDAAFAAGGTVATARPGGASGTAPPGNALISSPDRHGHPMTLVTGPSDRFRPGVLPRGAILARQMAIGFVVADDNPFAIERQASP